MLRISFTVVLGRYLMGMKRKKTKIESLKFLQYLGKYPICIRGKMK
jgi:hypothetical protein